MVRKSELPAVPPELADVALLDGPAIAAAARISISKFHQLVRDGHAPLPAIRQPRYSRWRLAEVRQWLEEMTVRKQARRY
jgi:predicted DNA-binding transcriptional regulator AlpA